jgi:RimJ/RimL family protein N-acetyltransferase/cytidylate kinase
MLPQATLKDVSRVDIDRIGWWLGDGEISSRWFGHYACGDPVHRGYDPEHMIEASEAEWNRVFDDEHRLIMSIYDEHDEHIGECLVALDGEGSAELSLLIGKKELWHRGYGTATVFEILDNALAPFDLDRIWVSVPEDNTAALGLFAKFGFVTEAKRELCRGRDGEHHRVSILGLDLNQYRARQSGGVERAMPIVSIAGLSGSRSNETAAEVARLLGARLAEGEITDKLLERLGCSEGELEALKHSFTSRWSRLLRAIAVPVAWPASYQTGNYWPMYEASYENAVIEESVGKKQYVDAFNGVIRQLSVEGDVVLHGQGVNRFVPEKTPSISVFVSASPGLRAIAVAAAHGAPIDEALDYLEAADRGDQTLCKNLLGMDLLDMSQYDLTVNLDRVSVKTGAQIIVGALRLAPQPAAREDATAPAFPVH